MLRVQCRALPTIPQLRTTKTLFVKQLATQPNYTSVSRLNYKNTILARVHNENLGSIKYFTTNKPKDVQQKKAERTLSQSIYEQMQEDPEYLERQRQLEEDEEDEEELEEAQEEGAEEVPEDMIEEGEEDEDDEREYDAEGKPLGEEEDDGEMAVDDEETEEETKKDKLWVNQRTDLNNAKGLRRACFIKRTKYVFPC